ncbi:hypothetical protein FQA47_009032 [Oryzias melastigma]|uniref:Uncharacterized protein n=1 Tax=Oryzias melastigma TaxID=30732 RepID=A0A834C3R9_ORYME|nr:hypothetical protein FQA47_009032 [Oryzias melastigma]
MLQLKEKKGEPQRLERSSRFRLSQPRAFSTALPEPDERPSRQNQASVGAGRSPASTVDVCVCGVVLRGAEPPRNFPSHGGGGGSRSLPHHRAAKTLISAGLWDAEPGMEPEPGLVKPRWEGSWSAGAVSAGGSQ